MYLNKRRGLLVVLWLCVCLGWVWGMEQVEAKYPNTRQGPEWLYKHHKPLFVVGNAPYQNWSNRGTLLHISAFTPKLKPAAGAVIFVGDRQVGQIGNRGSYTLRLNPSDFRSGSYMIRVYMHRGQTLFSGELRFNLYNRTSSFESTQVYVHTDRGVYRPGETIKLRSLVWRLRGDYRVRANVPVEVQLLNQQNTIVGGLKMKTEGYGVAAGEIVLPEHAPEGEYKLVVIYERTREETPLRVQRFRTPVIHIKHDVGRFLTVRQQSWPFKINLSYFVGGTVNKGSLSLQVIKDKDKKVLWQTQQPIDGRTEPYAFALDGNNLAQLKQQLSEGEVFFLEMTAKDEFDRSDTIRRRLRYVSNPYRAVLEADKDYYTTGETVTLAAKVLDLDGYPVANRKLNVQTSRLISWHERQRYAGSMKDLKIQDASEQVKRLLIYMVQRRVHSLRSCYISQWPQHNGRAGQIRISFVYNLSQHRAFNLVMSKDTIQIPNLTQCIRNNMNYFRVYGLLPQDRPNSVNIEFTLDFPGMPSAPSMQKLQATTDDNGVAVFKLKMGKQGFRAEVRDDSGTFLGGTDINWTTPKPMLSQLQQAVVHEGGPVPIEVWLDKEYVPATRYVQGDITDSSGAIVHTFLIPVKKRGERFVAAGNFRAPSWGTMLITLYALAYPKKDQKPHAVGLLTEGQQVTVHASRNLRFELKGLPKQAKPGQTIEVEVAVKGKKGLQDAMIGAAVVDAGVISMLDPLEKTPTMRFYQPQLKVLSTTGAKMLTWPVVARNWGSRRYDIALPPFGYNNGGYGYGRGYGQPSTASVIPGVRAKYIGPPQLIPKRQRARGSYGFGMSGGSIGSSSGYGGLGTKGLGGLTKSAPAKSMDAPMAAPSPEPIAQGARSSRGRGERADRSATVGDSSGKPLVQRSVQITIRKHFAPTSYWEPLLLAKRGRARFSFQLPDDIGSQQVILVANDRRGNIGLLRQNVQVTQALYVRSDLPPTITEGDRLQVNALVRNLTDTTQAMTVELKSPSFEVIGGSPASLKLVANSSQTIAFMIQGKRPGTGEYSLIARSKSHEDREVRKLFVHPAGVPHLTSKTEILQGKKPLSFKVSHDPKQYQTVFLSVAFPTIIPALQGIESLERLPIGAIDGIAGRLHATALVYDYLRRYNLLKQRGPQLRERVQNGLRALLATQNADGSWGWPWWQGLASNPIATSYALATLAHLRQIDLAVPQAPIDRAIAYLWKTQLPDRTWPTGHIVFWEGPSTRVQWSLTARIFHSIAAASTPQLRNSPQFKALLNKMRQYEENDPLTLSYILRGMLELTQINKMSAAQRRWFQLQATRLIEMRRHGYWEPQWFDAWGGQLQATLASLQVLSRMDSRRYESIIRESLLYLLSTRSSWGAWHNGPGTSAAIQAFTLLPPPRREIASTVRVLVNDREVAKVAIDPKDPFLSAIQLRMLELTSHLQAGENTISVQYDGRLSAPIRLDITRWQPQAQQIASLQFTREYKTSKSQIGQPVRVSLSLNTSSPKMRRIRIVEPLPPHSTVDERTLKSQASKQQILHFSVKDNQLHLDLMTKEQNPKVDYLLINTQSGKFTQPAGWAWFQEKDQTFRTSMQQQTQLTIH